MHPTGCNPIQKPASLLASRVFYCPTQSRGGAEKLNSPLSERPAIFESPQGHRNGAENVQKTEKKTFARIQS